MYSPYAKKHTLHEIEVVKKKRASELARGQRKFRSVTSGYGGFPRPKPEGREKPTKRVYVRTFTINNINIEKIVIWSFQPFSTIIYLLSFKKNTRID